jgi:hypothetical protein
MHNGQEQHTTPIAFPEDDSFDVGQDTRTGVALLEYRYDAPFKFTGKINNLTFKLEQSRTRKRTGSSFLASHRLGAQHAGRRLRSSAAVVEARAADASDAALDRNWGAHEPHQCPPGALSIPLGRGYRGAS